jgi:hypothetical protein
MQQLTLLLTLNFPSNALKVNDALEWPKHKNHDGSVSDANG